MKPKKLPTQPTVRFELEFAGWQAARLDEDGRLLRPVTAGELIKQVADYFEGQARAAGMEQFRVTVKPLD